MQGAKSSKPTLTLLGTEVPEGLHVQLLDVGVGPEIKVGDTISIHYLGQSWDGTIFDSPYSRGRPPSSCVSVGKVICGWDDGLVGQRAGPRALLFTPAEFGYGDHGTLQADIRGRATLVFVTETFGII